LKDVSEMNNPAIDVEGVQELIEAGRVLAAAGLVTAFGHVSSRVGAEELLITPPRPLGRLTTQRTWARLSVTATELPAGCPKEAWIHLAIAERRPDVGAVCRAQPEVVTALVSGDVPVLALHGQGAFVGSPVAVFDDACLIRDRSRAQQLAEQLGSRSAIVLRGNGAVTVGKNVGEAVARMWVLEASARMNSIAAAAGTPRPLSAAEQAKWLATEPELLQRIWAGLQESPDPRP
jgi:ribulose-5-phosphate 4-epimerase/fuculose-1-phosphate aldolase